LKINLFKSLYTEYTGTTYYYLSTNSENKSVSGILFDAEKFNGQFLNKHFPTTILTQPLENLYTIYELGGFFVPQNQGILIYNTPDKKYSVDVEKLESDKIYVFPDPNKIGNTIYTSDEENENIPLTYIINVEWNRTKISNGYRLNDVLSNNYNQLFYAYQSRQQNTKISTEGISKVTDNVTFWKGDKDQIWDGSFDDDIYPIDKDKKSLLLDEGVVVDWYCDDSSNEFGLYKVVTTPIPSSTPSPTASVTPTNTVTPTSTPVSTANPTPTITPTNTVTPTITMSTGTLPTPTITPTITVSQTPFELGIITFVEGIQVNMFDADPIFPFV